MAQKRKKMSEETKRMLRETKAAKRTRATSSGARRTRATSSGARGTVARLARLEGAVQKLQANDEVLARGQLMLAEHVARQDQRWGALESALGQRFGDGASRGVKGLRKGRRS